MALTFQLKVVHPLRVTGSTDGEALAERFLSSIGYISPGTGQRLEGGARSSAGFKLFYHCLATHPQRSWTAAQLTEVVGATPATTYRHLQRLKELGLVAEEPQQRYRFWHHSLSLAWEGVEFHARICQRNYSKVVDRIERLLGSPSATTTAEDSPQASAGRDGTGLDYPLAVPPETFTLTLAEMAAWPGDPPEGEGEQDTSDELTALLRRLLNGCGYLDRRGGKHDSPIAFHLFKDWLLARRDRVWTAEELATALSTSRPTVYRHLKRLERMGWLEKVILKGGHPHIAGFRLHGGSLSRAWSHISDQLELGLRGYRKAINQLVGLTVVVPTVPSQEQ